MIATLRSDWIFTGGAERNRRVCSPEFGAKSLAAGSAAFPKTNRPASGAGRSVREPRRSYGHWSTIDVWVTWSGWPVFITCTKIAGEVIAIVTKQVGPGEWFSSASVVMPPCVLADATAK